MLMVSGEPVETAREQTPHLGITREKVKPG